MVLQYRFAEGDDVKAIVRNLNNLNSEVKRLLRRTILCDAACVKIEAKPNRDLKKYNEDGLYRAESLLTYHRVSE